MILQWVVNEGHLMESGGQAAVFFSGGPDPNHQSSDAMHIDPLADRQSSLRRDFRRHISASEKRCIV